MINLNIANFKGTYSVNMFATQTYWLSIGSLWFRSRHLSLSNRTFQSKILFTSSSDQTRPLSNPKQSRVKNERTSEAAKKTRTSLFSFFLLPLLVYRYSIGDHVARKTIKEAN